MIARLFARWKEFTAQRALRKRMATLSDDERDALLSRAPFELYFEQGMEGAAFVIRRGKPDLGAAMSASPGFFPHWRMAEDWIIAHELKSRGH